MIAGVCGGLGRYTGVDPIIFRIVLATLAIFGGVGLVLYALAWLLVPDEATGTSEAERLRGAHRNPLSCSVQSRSASSASSCCSTCCSTATTARSRSSSSWRSSR